MKAIALLCRIVLGLAFLFFGANILHPFLSTGPEPAADTLVGKYFASMIGSGWMKAVGAGQVLGGLLVLAGGTLPLGLCLLCPITVNILLFHLLLTGGHGIAPGALCALLELVLLYAYRGSFSGILSTNQSPTL
ncbi:MAG: DoxX family protein [Acidobacteriaceae bacterium]|nr:DoxX family protein [Acidobacteriaceae bacterium]